VQATRASRPDPITHEQAVRLIESFRRFPVQDVTSATLMAALDTRRASPDRADTVDIKIPEELHYRRYEAFGQSRAGRG